MAWDPRVGPVVPASSKSAPDPAPTPIGSGPVPPRPWHEQVRDGGVDPIPDSPTYPAHPTTDDATPNPPSDGTIASAVPPPVLAPGRPLEPMHGNFGGAGVGAPPWSGSPDVTIIPPKRSAPDWGETSLGMAAPTEAGLSYLGWWLTGLLIYFNERTNWYVRFHALQSVLFTSALTIFSVVGYVVSSLLMDLYLTSHQPVFHTLALGVALFVLLAVVAAWLTPLIAAWSGVRLRIPFLAPYAERYAAPFIAENTMPHPTPHVTPRPGARPSQGPE